jgi:hypothetical protein
VLSEFFGWYPTFLAPILVATLLGSLPGALPLKAGLFLVLVQAAGAIAAFLLSSLLSESPIILFGTIGLVIFLSFSMIASGRGFFPVLLVLICFATIPIVTMATPEQAGGLPRAFVRAMAIAVITVWLAHAIWPKVVAKPAAASVARNVEPVTLALAGTAIVLPLMLVYLMYSLTDALPVLITTVVLVVNFDPRRGALQGLVMVLGNFIGGMIAVLCHALLGVAPSLFTLACMTFVLGLTFGKRIERGGPAGPVALITFNQAIIMLSLGLMPGPSSPGLWATRLLQFAIAYGFAVGMMYLILPRVKRATTSQAAGTKKKLPPERELSSM